MYLFTLIKKHVYQYELCQLKNKIHVFKTGYSFQLVDVFTRQYTDMRNKTLKQFKLNHTFIIINNTITSTVET